MGLNATLMLCQHFIEPLVTLAVTVAASTRTNNQVTVGVKAALTRVGHTLLPIGGPLNKLALVAETLEGCDLGLAHRPTRGLVFGVY